MTAFSVILQHSYSSKKAGWSQWTSEEALGSEPRCMLLKGPSDETF